MCQDGVVVGESAETHYFDAISYELAPPLNPRMWSSPQQGDLRVSGRSSSQGAGGGARTRDKRVPADPRQKGPCRCHGGLASHRATDAPLILVG
ncbi:hypothetical protein PoB_006728200 [Plakobranchus ocellatus]|uniref:Uncharacterized protein n=1 Tax=Plakobranchus ocellatus TaxID=259542 RepID=A0AAV4D9N9_9GAST|nr:hypothetical protein PoB_006728200 [Plakobranchus ocellatus]